MGRAFSEELDRMEETLLWSTEVEVPPPYFRGLAAPGLRVIVGSGGSFTAATALATLECNSGVGVALALTPLQYAQQADKLAAHAVLLISAEGKNRDILHAASKAFALATSSEVLTFSNTSPLTKLAAQTPSVRVFSFNPPWGRDGYLATNSLLASIMLGCRLRGSHVEVGPLAAFLGLYRTTDRLDHIAGHIARTRRLLVLHGTNGLIAAVDLESKLSEAAFAFTQLSDLRQFAHGRHIQLSSEDAPVPVISFISQHEHALWSTTRDHVPAHVAMMECALPADQATASVAGLLIVMALVEKVALVLNHDPGQPVVPEFARRIHALDTSTLLARPVGGSSNPKLAVLEASMTREAAAQAGMRFIERLRTASFRILVLDFDGTLCETARRYEGLDERLQPIVINLLKSGLTIAFASGRGNSLYDDLRTRLPDDLHSKCFLGCYSGSFVLPLTQPWPELTTNLQLTSILQQLQTLGINAENGFKLDARVAQLTIRSATSDGIDILFTLCSSLVSELTGWRVFRSAHSIDILTPAATKNSVISSLSGWLGIDPLTEVCRIGDRGEPFGNDAELLGEGLSLSVDGLSADSNSCWLFGEPSLGSVERAAHYLGSLIVKEGKASFNERVLELWQQQLV